MTDLLKSFSKHTDWAWTYQRSKIKVIVDEIKKEAFTKVETGYDFDKIYTEEQNKLQMFRQYVQYIATHEKIASEIAKSVIQEMLFVNCILDNPFHQ